MSKSIRGFLIFLCLLIMIPGCNSGSSGGTGGDISASESTLDTALRTTATGSVQGLDQGATLAWLGIPYAKPPVGALRWRAPQDIAPWSGTLAATSLGKPATQIAGIQGSGDASTYGALMGAEDCLTLNIWQPKAAGANLPVLVLIHGGGDYAGDAGMPALNGAAFAAANKVVVVSVNYRLGLLGWFTHPALRNGADPLDASGNFGTLDIIKALAWVKTNIADFDGDPHQVTLMGQGAGGCNVFSLLASPLAKDLFGKAIVQSGTPTSSEMDDADTLAEDLLIALLKADGSAATDAAAKTLLAAKDQTWIAAYLRSKTTREIYAAYAAGHAMTAGNQLAGILPGFKAIFNDGTVIPSQGVRQAVMQGAYTKLPLIVGFNADEGTAPLPMADVAAKDPGRTADAAFMESLASSSSTTYKPLLDLLARTGLNPNESLPQSMPYTTLLIGLSKQQDNLYSYTFTWDGEPKPFNTLIGAAAGLELPFVLGNFGQTAGDPLSFAWSTANRTERERLSQAMMGYWGRFMKTGDPNMAGLPLWKPYVWNTGGDRRIYLDANLADSTNPKPTPPWQAATGYGSKARYICDSYSSYELGSGTDGTRVWYYVPDKLKKGDKAPVVVFLHGFFVICPPLYMGEIEHYLKQGCIVIFPQFNYGWLGLMVDLDQNKHLARAIAGTNQCLAKLGTIADTTDVTLVGHSLGGMLSLGWIADGGIHPKVIVSQNPCIFPKVLTDMIKVIFKALDWRTKAAAIDVPIIFMACQEDYFALFTGVRDAYNACTNAPSKVLYYVPSDYYGAPDLAAGHASALQDTRPIPSWLVDLFLENGEENALDFRVFYAATDAAMDGLTRVPFDMGTWSDGHPVKAPRIILEATKP